MGVNLDRPFLWKSDISLSVDMYNEWFLKFAPKAFCDTRVHTTKVVVEALELTKNLTEIQPNVLRQNHLLSQHYECQLVLPSLEID